MSYLQSKTGEIKHRLEWQYDLDAFWEIIPDRDLRAKFKRPHDAWERFVRVLGLEEVCDETYNNSSVYHGVF